MSFDWEGRLGAVIAGSFGKGRAVAIGPHPELREGETETDIVRDAPPLRAALLLRNALYWSSGRRCPASA